MVECEYLRSACVNAYPSVLIDTWWNVNPFNPAKVAKYIGVLIDTWWNVNII